MGLLMTVLRDVRRLALGVLAPLAVVAAVLSACGGGTSQVAKFKPNRLVVLGDEASALVDDGAHNAFKYSVNGMNASGVRDCTVLPTAVQSVAAYYGFVFAECNTAGAAVAAFNRAKVGATVADASTGLARQIAEGALGDGDLVTVFFGTNDVIQVYELFASGALSRDAALAEIQARGALAADQMNSLLATGAKALLFLAPQMGVSPYANAKLATDGGAATLLNDLTYEFNGYLRTRIDARKYDARNFGLIISDDVVAAVAKTPSGYTSYLVSPYDVGDAVCVAALPACTTATADLVSGGLYNTHLWASDRFLGYPGQALLANQALSRLANLPL
jgi:outer membrane lipase/esterase